MSGRTPSFIVVGLVIIMFLLGSFYMSCSSKNTELRISLEQFEERIRTLTLKHTEAEKKLENVILRKRELDEEKLIIQRQMEKKDSEINDLNTKLNEKLTEVRSLRSDKGVLDEQLKDYRSVSDTLLAKNTLIERLQQQLNDAKQSSIDEINRLKQEYEFLKNSASSRISKQPANNEPVNTFIIPNERFRPLLSNNFTTRGLGSLFNGSPEKSNNLSNEVKAQIVPAVFESKNNVIDASIMNTSTTTTTIQNEQQQQQAVNNDKPQQEANQNVPPPPVVKNEQNQFVGQVERPQVIQDGANGLQENQVPAAAAAAAENSQYQQRLQRSLNNELSENKSIESLPNIGNEINDEDQIEVENARRNAVLPAELPKQNNADADKNEAADLQPAAKSNNDNYRIIDRERLRRSNDNLQEGEQLVRGGESDNNNNNNNKEENQDLRKPIPL